MPSTPLVRIGTRGSRLALTQAGHMQVKIAAALGFGPEDAERVAPSRVCRLAALLDDNQRMLAHHLKAVDEIASLVARAMQEADSDGTYGRGGA